MTGTPRHRGVVLAVILVGYLLILIDVSILMAALPRIHADLGFSAAGLSWAQNAYTLTFGGLLLLGARVGDLLGRRRTFMFGIGRSADAGWGAASPIAPLALGIALLAAFVANQARASQPLLPLRL